jgi:hypothetical protein
MTVVNAKRPTLTVTPDDPRDVLHPGRTYTVYTISYTFTAVGGGATAPTAVAFTATGP